MKEELLYRELPVRGGYKRYQILLEFDKMESLIRKATMGELSFVKAWTLELFQYAESQNKNQER